MTETRLFVELIKLPNGNIDIFVGGGSKEDGLMLSHETIDSALSDLKGRLEIDYHKMLGNYANEW